MTRSPLVEAAAEYLNLGLQVIALTGKMPNGLVHRHGLHQAIAGPVQNDDDWQLLEGAFDHTETTGVGILTSAPYVVVDIDGEEGAQQWEALLGRLLLPDRWVAQTGRGLHLWFGTELVTGTIKLGPKLDLKGEGGYVAAPPSRHPDGRTYEWLAEPGLPPYEVPDELRKVIQYHVEQKSRRLEGKAMKKPIRGPRYNEGDTVFFAQSNFDALMEGMQTAAEGNRNNYLHWAAATITEEGGVQEDYEQLAEAALAVGLEPEEVHRTIRSAGKLR
jgi:hypothetical protein